MGGSRRVVITGVGAIASNGSNTETFWKSTLNGVSGIRRIRSFDVSNYPCQIGGEVLDFNAEKFADHRTLRRTGRAVHLALGCLYAALEDSRLDLTLARDANAGIIYGMGCPPLDVIAATADTLRTQGPRRIEPFRLSGGDSYSVAAAIRRAIGTENSAFVVVSGCTAGLDSIGLAAENVRTGRMNVVICGSADAPLSPLAYAAFCASGMMSRRNSDPQRASRPFDLKRDGGVLSEGAGALILECFEEALARGAKIYGEVLGFRSVTEKLQDGGQPPDETARRAFTRSMMEALKEAGVSPEEVDYVCAHAPSDPDGDRIETEAIKAVFGDWAYRMPVSSIKSCVGNPVAAAGPLQTIATLLAMRDGMIPPTINYEFPDPACDLDCVPNVSRYNHVEIGMVNSHGMGGNYSSLVIGRCNWPGQWNLMANGGPGPERKKGVRE
jgi:3-oxoacyl-[acyl-carrier-protein] synthase II